MNPSELWKHVSSALEGKSYNSGSYQQQNKGNRKGSMFNYPDDQQLNVMDYLYDQGFRFESIGGNKYAIIPNSSISPGGSDYSSLILGKQRARNSRIPRTEVVWTRYAFSVDDYHIPSLNALLIQEYNESHTDQKSFDSKADRAWANERRMEWIKDYYARYGSYKSNFEIDGDDSLVTRKRTSNNRSSSSENRSQKAHPGLHFSYEDSRMDYKDEVNDNNTAYKFLTEKRGIDRETVNMLLENDLVRGFKPSVSHKNGETKKFDANVSFPFKLPTDSKETPAVGEDKIIIDNKGDKSGIRMGQGGLSNYGFNFKTGDGKGKLMVFESAIDAISYYSQNKDRLDKDLQNTSFLSISGSGTKLATIEKYKELLFQGDTQNQDFNEIVMALDTDEVGRRSMLEAVENIYDKGDYVIYHDEKVDTQLAKETKNKPKYSMEAPILKDWNDVSKAVNIEKKQLGDSQFKLNVDEYAKQVVYFQMDSLSSNGKQAFERVAYDYSILSQQSQNNQNLKLDASPIKDMQETLSSISDNEKNSIVNFMKKGGGSHISGDDLYRLAKDNNKIFEVSTNFLNDDFKSTVGEYKNKSFEQKSTDYFMNSLHSNTAKQNIPIIIGTNYLIEQSKESPENMGLKAQSEAAKTILDRAIKMVNLDANYGNKDVKHINEYVNALKSSGSESLKNESAMVNNHLDDIGLLKTTKEDLKNPNLQNKIRRESLNELMNSLGSDVSKRGLKVLIKARMDIKAGNDNPDDNILNLKSEAANTLSFATVTTLMRSSKGKEDIFKIDDFMSGRMNNYDQDLLNDDLKIMDDYYKSNNIKEITNDKFITDEYLGRYREEIFKVNVYDSDYSKLNSTLTKRVDKKAITDLMGDLKNNSSKQALLMMHRSKSAINDKNINNKEIKEVCSEAYENSKKILFDNEKDSVYNKAIEHIEKRFDQDVYSSTKATQEKGYMADYFKKANIDLPKVQKYISVESAKKLFHYSENASKPNDDRNAKVSEDLKNSNKSTKRVNSLNIDNSFSDQSVSPKVNNKIVSSGASIDKSYSNNSNQKNWFSR